MPEKVPFWQRATKLVQTDYIGYNRVKGTGKENWSYFRVEIKNGMPVRTDDISYKQFKQIQGSIGYQNRIRAIARENKTSYREAQRVFKTLRGLNESALTDEQKERLEELEKDIFGSP